MKCNHERLIVDDPDIAAEVNITPDDSKKFPEYFMYRRYKCEGCGRIVTVLHAVVENN